MTSTLAHRRRCLDCGALLRTSELSEAERFVAEHRDLHADEPLPPPPTPPKGLHKGAKQSATPPSVMDFPWHVDRKATTQTEVLTLINGEPGGWVWVLDGPGGSGAAGAFVATGDETVELADDVLARLLERGDVVGDYSMVYPRIVLTDQGRERVSR